MDASCRCTRDAAVIGLFGPATAEDLLVVYDWLKADRNPYKSSELRTHLAWHWLAGTMVMARQDSKPVGVALLYRVKDVEELKAGGVVYNDDGDIGFVAYAYAPKGHRNKGTLDLLDAAIAEHCDWAETVIYLRAALGDRLKGEGLLDGKQRLRFWQQRGRAA